MWSLHAVHVSKSIAGLLWFAVSIANFNDKPSIAGIQKQFHENHLWKQPTTQWPKSVNPHHLLFDELLCSPFTIFHPPSLCQASTRPSKAVDFTVGWGPMGQSDQSDKPWENNGSSKVLQIWRASNWSHNVEGWCWSNPGLSRNTCPVGISKSWITTATTILLPN